MDDSNHESVDGGDESELRESDENNSRSANEVKILLFIVLISKKS